MGVVPLANWIRLGFMHKWSLGLFCAKITRLQWPSAVPPSCNVTLNHGFVVVINIFCADDEYGVICCHRLLMFLLFDLNKRLSATLVFGRFFLDFGVSLPFLVREIFITTVGVVTVIFPLAPPEILYCLSIHGDLEFISAPRSDWKSTIMQSYIFYSIGL